MALLVVELIVERSPRKRSQCARRDAGWTAALVAQCLGFAALLGLFGPATFSFPEEAPHAIKSLGEGVPSDALFYFHYRMDPKGAVVRHLLPVREALSRSGFLVEITKGLSQAVFGAGEVGDREKKRFERESAYWQRILADVSWWSLFSSEGAIALRRDGEQREFLLLFRVGPGEGEALLSGLRRVLFALSTLNSSYEIDSSTREDESVIVLYHLLDPSEALCVAWKDDVVLFSTSRSLLKRSLQLLSGEGSDLGYVRARERASDLKRLGSLDPSLGGFEIHIQPAKLFPELPVISGFESFVMAGCSTPSRNEAGGGISYSFHSQFAPGGTENADLLRRTFLERPSVAFFQRLVPKDAGFLATSGCEPKGLYEFLRRLVTQFLPEGEGLVEEIEEREKKDQLDLQGTLSFLTGRWVELVKPGEGTVFLFELKEPEKGRKELDAFSRWLETMLRRLGLELKPEEVKGLEGDLRSFTMSLPSLGGLLDERRWFFGTTGEFFVVGSSLDLLSDSLLVWSGKAPGIGENPDISKQLKVPAGDLQRITSSSPVTALWFLRAGLASLPLLSGVLPEGVEYAVSGAFLKASARLAPAAALLRFLDRECSYTVREGNALRGAGTVFLKDMKE